MALEPSQLFETCRGAIERVNASAIQDERLWRDEATFWIEKRWIVPVIKALRNASDLSFDMISDVTAIDFLNLENEVDIDDLKRQYRESASDSGFQSIEHWGAGREKVLEMLLKRHSDLDPREIEELFEDGYKSLAPSAAHSDA